MKLSLNVLTYSGVAPERTFSITLNQEGATIGRREDNTLVLPDIKSFISGHHAVIEYEHPSYYITDISTNGVYINQAKMSRGQGNSLKLNDGDELNMGDYCILVKLIDENQVKDDLPPIATSSKKKISLPAGLIEENNPDPIQSMIEKNELFPFKGKSDRETSENPLELPDNKIQKSSLKQKNDSIKSNLNHIPDHKEAFQPFIKKLADQLPLQNHIESPPVIFDNDWYVKKHNKKNEVSLPLASSENDSVLPQKSEPTKPIQKPQSAKTDHTDKTSPHESRERTAHEIQLELIQSFMRGAQLDEGKFIENLDPKTFYIIGKILRASIQGTMDVLLGRAKIKNEMHLDVTLIRPRHNNPFKFSVSVDEALTKLLSSQDASYLPPEEAIKEAFDDIKAHQYSVIAGMQTALLNVLQRFDPKKLEQHLHEQNPLSAKIPLHRQAKLWGLFKQMYVEIEHEAEDNFNQLFGQAFADAYEQQTQNLKASKNDFPFK